MIAQSRQALYRLSDQKSQALIRAEIDAQQNDAREADTPSFEPNGIDPYQPPDPFQYRRTWESARSDVEQLMLDGFGEATALRRLIERRETIFAALSGRIKGLRSRVEAAELLGKGIDGVAEGVETIRIDFSDPSLFDRSLVVGTPAHQDTDRGVVTQAVTHLENRASNAQIIPVIGDAFEGTYGLIGILSNGLPGNTHEVYPVQKGELSGATPSGSPGFKYEFVGASDARINHGHILDASIDTWYEFEAVNVPESVKKQTKGYGWAYDLNNEDRLNWAFDPQPDSVLRLTLRLRFDEPILANQIRIHPFVPPNEGATPPILRRVKIAKDSGEPSQVLESEITQGAKGEWTLSFPMQSLQAIDFYFEQPTSFNILVGHWAYIRKTVIEETSQSFWGLITWSVDRKTTTSRVDGPNPPISALGVVESSALEKLGGVITTAGTLVYAAATAATAIGAASLAGVAALGPVGLAAIGVGVLLSGLYRKQQKVLSDEVITDLEAFDGWRWCIGIREIEVLSKRYAAQSMWVSRPLRASGPISAIRLEANERVPNGFPEQSVIYEVSIDDGETWYPIQPGSSWQGHAPEILYVGSAEAIEGDPRRVGVIETDESPDSLRLRISLIGNSNQAFETIELDGVQVWVETGGSA